VKLFIHHNVVLSKKKMKKNKGSEKTKALGCYHELETLLKP
jgi:hypothetical protein